MASSRCLRGCLLFNAIFNGFWIFFYLSTSRSYHKVPENVIYNLNSLDPTITNVSSKSDINVLVRSLDSKVMVKPYIFIGGVPSSGTTLARAILDAHPDVRCGEETRLVPRILQMRERWRRSIVERKRLIAAGLNDTVINMIVRSFVSNVIELHGKKAPHLCNKDPLSLSQMPLLHELFPNAKFLLMIRDGRAVASSIVSRNVTITGVDHKSHLSAALFWNRAVQKMWDNCEAVGTDFCLPVYFEKLVDSPEEEMRKMLNFLNISWSSNVLHHSDFLNSEISLSK